MHSPERGQRLHILSAGDDGTLLEATLLDMMADRWQLTWPANRQLPDASSTPCRVGMMWTIHFLAANKGICQFQTRILDTDESSSNRMVSIAAPRSGELEVIQRRSFARVPVDLPVQLEQWTLAESPRALLLYATDLSAGGLAVRILEYVELQPGDRVQVSFHLSDPSLDVDTLCTVNRVSARNSHGCTYASVVFTQLSEHQLQRIVQYCFRRQRQLRYIFPSDPHVQTHSNI